jgi:MFS superfamily sulfate permease-like transporter
MDPLIHILVFVLVMVGSVFVIVRNYRAPSGARWFVALTLGSALSIAVGLSALVTSDRGQPLQQWVLPGLCLVAVLAFAREGKMRNVAVGGLLLAMLGLCQHFRIVVAGDEYIGVESALHADGVIEAQSEWHTSLTGFYGVTEIVTAKPKDTETQAPQRK